MQSRVHNEDGEKNKLKYISSIPYLQKSTNMSWNWSGHQGLEETKSSECRLDLEELEIPVISIEYQQPTPITVTSLGYSFPQVGAEFPFRSFSGSI